ncbi:MAG: hypothetical protein JXB39_07520 [Deltaproteobacteria bacterium]|nr:hypothetical protein [Deltaproteobacteria bacterium]
MRILLPLLTLVLAACGGGEDPAAGAIQGATDKLRQGDLPGGIEALLATHSQHPDSVDAAVAAAYGAYLSRDWETADRILAEIQPKAEERKGEITVRRALVALARGDLDQTRALGEASGQPAGALLAAEVALADGERDKAAALLQTAGSSPDRRVADTARAYLTLLGDGDPRVQGLSEAQALWALGSRQVAVRSAEELVMSLPADHPSRPESLLLWAGRAAAAGETQVASNLVESVGFPPQGQQWRVQATRGIVACAEGDAARCAGLLDGLTDVAPPGGLADARATAAILLVSKDPEAAKAIAGTEPSPSVARALLAAGDGRSAAELLAGGPLDAFLSAGGGG